MVLYMRTRVNMRIDTDLWVRVKTEAEGLGQARTKFVERALEQALGGHAPNSLELAAKLKEMWHNDPVLERQLASEEGVASSASSRAPEIVKEVVIEKEVLEMPPPSRERAEEMDREDEARRVESERREVARQFVSQSPKPKLPPGVKTGADVMRERQARLNKERGR